MWIQTIAKFCDGDPESEFSQDYWTEFHLDLEQIISHNRASDGYTTVELITGFRQTIGVKYMDFLKLFYSKLDPKSECTIIVDKKADYEYHEQLEK